MVDHGFSMDTGPPLCPFPKMKTSLAFKCWDHLPGLGQERKGERRREGMESVPASGLQDVPHSEQSAVAIILQGRRE